MAMRKRMAAQKESPMTIAMIRRFVLFWPDGKIFTTRDCLVFGMRGAVDRALGRMVNREEIYRLARGVFVKDSTFRRKYSNYDIAKAKAESFGRKIVCGPQVMVDPFSNEARERRKVRKDDTVYFIDGRSSQFRINGRIIRFKQIAKRKLHLAGTKAGQSARFLWNQGNYNIDQVAFYKATSLFNTWDLEEFKRNIRWMPAFVSDLDKKRYWDRSYERTLPQLWEENDFELEFREFMPRRNRDLRWCLSY